MKTQAVIFDTIIPYPEPVHIASLLSDIEAVIKKHVILSDHAAAALAVWVLHTWTFQLRDIVAYVAIESPEKRCGKTTLLSVLSAMASKSLIASNLTVGALFRAIDTCRPTLFIDEADTFLAGNGTMRGIINSGNTWRTAYVLRLSAPRLNRRPATLPIQLSDVSSQRNAILPLPAGEGRGSSERSERQLLCCSSVGESAETLVAPENSETGLKKFSCWCPKVIAMIGQVPDTIADRSIVVPMSRKLVTETCSPLAELNTVEIKAKCARFAMDARDAVAEAPKFRANGLNDRAADTFDPLFVIARLAGEEWEKKLHAAALALNAAAHSNNSGTELLLDILTVFTQSGRERMLIRDLATTLREGGHGFQSFALKYSALNERRISEILRSYGIKTVPVRDGKEVGRGYTVSQFQQVIRRYVPVDDFRARAEELIHHGQLQAEAAKEEAMIERIMAGTNQAARAGDARQR